MRIEDPEIYFGKKIKVTSTDGTVLTGELYGYDYDIDDGGNEFLEFDVEVEGGAVVSYTEDEIANIEVL
nr:MAG TPA: hypothetical protein [Caudoviricetes sp.]